MTAVFEGEDVGETRPKRYLHSLYRFEHKQAKFAVKDIECQGIFELSAWLEVVVAGIRGFLKGKPIGPEAIVVDMDEVSGGTIAVADVHSAGGEKIELLFDGEWWLIVLHD
jgi:hypothetical protein